MTAPEKYVLRLYVTGLTSRSTRAITTVRDVCERHLQGRYDLEIIDVYQQPGRIIADQIVAIPTLVRKLPQPLRKIIGDLSDTERTLVGLQLRPRNA